MNERFGPPRELAVRARLKELLKHPPVLTAAWREKAQGVVSWAQTGVLTVRGEK